MIELLQNLICRSRRHTSGPPLQRSRAEIDMGTQGDIRL